MQSATQRDLQFRACLLANQAFVLNQEEEGFYYETFEKCTKAAMIGGEAGRLLLWATIIVCAHCDRVQQMVAFCYPHALS